MPRQGIQAGGSLSLLDAGRYQILLQDDAGIEVSRDDFWIVAPDAKASIEIAGRRFAVGEPLPLAWQNAPGNRHDWVDVFETAGPDAQVPDVRVRRHQELR